MIRRVYFTVLALLLAVAGGAAAIAADVSTDTFTVTDPARTIVQDGVEVRIAGRVHTVPLPAPVTVTVTGPAVTTTVESPPPPPTPPSPGVTADVFQHTLTPGVADSAGLIASWTVWDGPGFETYPAGATNGDKHGTIRWEPGGQYAATKTTYMRCAWRFLAGSPARLLNFHTQPADAPDGWNQRGIDGPPYTTGVSPVAIDWKEGQVEEGQTGMMLVLQPNERRGRYHWTLLPEQTMRQLRGDKAWLTLELEVRWGIDDGYVKVWRVNTDGSRSLLVDTGTVATHWLNQGMVTLWQGGGYWNIGLPQTVTTANAGCLVGRTRDEMLMAKPTFYSGWGSGSRTRLGTFTYMGG